MCIYCDTDNYRKIYENHHGDIPKESDGRSYEIHHIDGDHSNNSPTNLMAVTLQEHYDIHYAQGDLGACWYMAWQRMDKSPEEISEIARANALKRVENGTNPLMTRPDGTSLILDRMKDPSYVNPWSTRPDGTSASSDRVKNGTHHLLGGKIQSDVNKKNWDNGTHHLIGMNEERIKNDTHNFLKREDGTSLASDRVENGTHPFMTRPDGTNTNLDLIAEGKHNTQIMKTCEYCDKTMNSFIFGRWHGDKCKKAPPK